MNRKWLIVIAILVALAFVGGMELTKIWNKSKEAGSQTASPQLYVSFVGDYSFLVPDGYMIDDSSISNTQLVSKKDEKIEAKTVDEIYSKGAMAIQPFTPVLNDDDAFKNYVSNTLKNAVSTSLKGSSEVTFGKKNNLTTAVIKTTVNGGLVRIQYILNSAKPVILASGNDDASFQSISDSLDIASKNKEFTDIQSTVLTATSLIQNRMDDDTYRLSSDSFKSKTSLSDLKKLFDQSTFTLSSNVSIIGGVIADTNFSTALLFTKPAPKAGGQATSAVGVINLEKSGNQWKLAGLTLPTSDAFKATN